jgi:putative acetyltransferase
MTEQVTMQIRPIDLHDEQVEALLQLHLSAMHENSPPGSVFALDLAGLRHRSVSFFGAWDGPSLMAFGALKELASDQGEIKSMRTAPAHLRRGAAAQLLEHLIALGRARGYVLLSLETGSGPLFEPAIALYCRYGFETGPPFGDYTASPFNQFMHLKL